MRILYVITELDRGGAEQALFQVARGVRKAGHKVVVAALFHADGAIGRELAASGITVRDLGASGFHLGARWRFRELCAEFRPDLIHAWLTRANVFCRWFGPRIIPLICSARVREHRKLNIFLERFAPRTYARYLCVSSSVADFAQKNLRVPLSKIRVIQNGVDFDRFHTVTDLSGPTSDTSKTTVTKPERFMGLTVARMVREKGLDILVAGLARLPDELDWQWHFAGAETDKKFAGELKKTVVANGLAERVTWHGSLEPDELLSLYKKCRLFALPSRFEGQPNVVLEAMAAGLPVLASETDGIADLIQAANQDKQPLETVSPNSAEEWASCIASLGLDQDRRNLLMNNGAAFAKQRSWRRVVEEHLELYETFSGG